MHVICNKSSYSFSLPQLLLNNCVAFCKANMQAVYLIFLILVHLQYFQFFTVHYITVNSHRHTHLCRHLGVLMEEIFLKEGLLSQRLSISICWDRLYCYKSKRSCIMVQYNGIPHPPTSCFEWVLRMDQAAFLHTIVKGHKSFILQFCHLLRPIMALGFR